jgi:hypothetical protein
MMSAELFDLDSTQNEWWSDDDDASYRDYCLRGEFGPHSGVLTPQFVTPIEARWLEYLRGLEGRQLASAEIAKAAEALWFKISDAVAGIQPPNANPLEGGGIRFSWNAPDKYMQIELANNAFDLEWFYRDSQAQRSDFADGTIENAITDDFATRLSSMF